MNFNVSRWHKQVGSRSDSTGFVVFFSVLPLLHPSEGEREGGDDSTAPPRSSLSPKQPAAAQAGGCLSHRSGLISAPGRRAEVNFTAWLRLEGSRCRDLAWKEVGGGFGGVDSGQ